MPTQLKTTLVHTRGSFPDATRISATIASTDRTKVVAGAIAQRMLSVRDILHKPSLHDEAPKITTEEGRMRSSLCHEAGFCVHGREGAATVQMSRRLKTVMTKVRFPRGTQRAMLTSGQVCILAVGTQPVAAGDDGGAEAPAPVAPGAILNTWWHVGVHEYNPVVAVGQILAPISADPLPLIFPSGTIAQQGTWSFRNYWEFVRDLDKQRVWHARFFQLERSQRLLGTIVPAACTLVELAPFPTADHQQICF